MLVSGKPARRTEGAPRRITAVAGFGKSWRTVMSRGTPYNNQRQLGVGAWPTQAVDKGWKDGFRITAVGGDDDPAHETDGWLFVMTKNSGQDSSPAGEYPSQWIQERW